MVAHCALDFERAIAPMLSVHARQSLLQLAEPILGGLRGRALHDHAMHKGFLLRHALLNFADVPIGQRTVRSRHESLLFPQGV